MTVDWILLFSELYTKPLDCWNIVQETELHCKVQKEMETLPYCTQTCLHLCWASLPAPHSTVTDLIGNLYPSAVPSHLSAGCPVSASVLPDTQFFFNAHMLSFLKIVKYLS